MFPILDHVIALSPSPTYFAQGLAVCLEPLFDGLYETLMEQLTAYPGLFQLPGEETGAAGFMETWIRVLREQTGRMRAVRSPCRVPLPPAGVVSSPPRHRVRVYVVDTVWRRLARSTWRSSRSANWMISAASTGSSKSTVRWLAGFL